MSKQDLYVCVAGLLLLLLGSGLGCVYFRQMAATGPEVSGETVFTDNPVMEMASSFPEEEISPDKGEVSQEYLYAQWLDEYVTKDFLLGRVSRTKDPLFIKVGEEHTERDKIYLLVPVYEAYKKMYEAALADGVKLVITSGHRTFMEQACEWELRWNNPGKDVSFGSDLEKARFVLQYRSMPGTSRHHWGTDIDLNSFRLSYYQTAQGKKVYNWLKENANKYGFYQPYTALGEGRDSGYQEEVWHWSYLPVARFMLDRYMALVSAEDIKGFKGDQTVRHLDLIPLWVYGIDQSLYASVSKRSDSGF